MQSKRLSTEAARTEQHVSRSAKSLRVLIVLEQGLDLPSAWVSALQYVDRFALDTKHVLTIVSLLKPPQGSVARLVFILLRLRLRGLARYLEQKLMRRHQDHIVRLAGESDVVFEVKLRQIEFHRRLRRLCRPKLLFCFSDSLWLPFFRERGWEHLDEILQTSDGITSESEYLDEYARKFNTNIFRVHDCPQVEDFDAVRDGVVREPGKVLLGWVGSTTNSTSLYRIFEPLEWLAKQYPQIELRIVGGHPMFFPRFEHLRFSYVSEFDQRMLIDEALRMDVGLFPLFNVQESLARGTLKPMIYMSGGAVAVCQNIGDSRILIQDGVNGMLAGSDQEWVKKISWLIERPIKRREIAANGLKTIREKFSRQKCFAQLLHAIEHV